MADTDQTDVTQLTVQLLSAYLSNNEVAHTDIAGLIRSTRHALVEEHVPAPAEVVPEVYAPAVSVRKSLASPDHIISLIDGKPYKTLKRHLTQHGLTPQAYRARYNLPASYPLVAPSFAERRRAIAAQIGLGRRAPLPDAATPVEAAPARKAPDKKATAAKTAAKAPAAAVAAPKKPAARKTAARPAAPKR